MRGTEGSGGIFFDPSGQWLGFFRPNQGLLKMAVTGGAVVPLAPLTALSGGGAWTADGRIVFQPNVAAGALQQVAADGGGPVTPLTTLADGDVAHRWPDIRLAIARSSSRP